MLKREIKDNKKLNGLQGQIGEMHNDFEEMKNHREEARHILDAKFADIYKQLEELRKLLENQGKNVNEQLTIFKEKFNNLLEELKNELKNQFDEEKKE